MSAEDCSVEIQVAHARGAELSRRLAVPDGWRDHGGGLWGWFSPEGAVTVSIHIYADGSTSPPAVIGAGSFRIAARGLRQALDAQAALLDYVARRTP